MSEFLKKSRYKNESSRKCSNEFLVSEYFEGGHEKKY